MGIIRLVRETIQPWLHGPSEAWGRSSNGVRLDLVRATPPMHLQDILKRYNIPTAAYEVFTDAQRAKDFIRSLGAPIVVKASGLAAGKGVVVARTVEEAYKAVDDMLVTKIFGNAGLWEPGGSRRYGRCPHFWGACYTLLVASASPSSSVCFCVHTCQATSL